MRVCMHRARRSQARSCSKQSAYGLAGRRTQQGQPQWIPMCVTAGGWGKWVVADQCSFTDAAVISHLHCCKACNSHPPFPWYCKCWTGVSSSSGYEPTVVNDNNSISYMFPVFAGNEVAPFLGIPEWKMTGIPMHPGNRSPGMQTLLISYLIFSYLVHVTVGLTVLGNKTYRNTLSICQLCYFD